MKSLVVLLFVALACGMWNERLVSINHAYWEEFCQLQINRTLQHVQDFVEEQRNIKPSESQTPPAQSFSFSVREQYLNCGFRPETRINVVKVLADTLCKPPYGFYVKCNTTERVDVDEKSKGVRMNVEMIPPLKPGQARPPCDCQ
jgi:hypothetical protein